MLNENLSDWYVRCAVCAAVASDAGSAMVCTSDTFPVIMSLYLFQVGCRRRGSELLNCLGLAKSYRPTRDLVLSLGEQGQQKLLRLGPLQS
jgi:hypothetical protein